MPAVLPQMERLIEVLDGRWNCQVTYQPEGEKGVGWEQCRTGPGRSSILFDTRAHGERGTFEGAGFITWNHATSAYDLYSLTSLSPEPGIFTGRWDGEDVVFDGYEYIGGQRVASRHSITDVSANAFVYTVDVGSAPENLMRAMTIRYTRD